MAPHLHSARRPWLARLREPRLRTIVLLACVLGLDSADLGTVGAVAPQLERSLHAGDLQIGVLASVVYLTAAVATLPVGWLTDHMRRVPLLAGSVTLWSVASLVNGAATSFTMLLLTRLALGAVQATSGPTLASLTGDYFRVRERSRVFGYIHAGELVGGAFGFVVSGELAAWLSWRWSFWVLAIPGFVLALALARGLPEPARGGASRFRHAERDREEGELLARLVREQGISPTPARVLQPHQVERMPARGAVRYVLGLPTLRLLIAAFALGYFFLGGARTFGIIFFRGHYRLGQAAATAAAAALGAGALAGVLIGGRLADRRLARGRLRARVTVSALGYVAAAALFVVPILAHRIEIALPLYVLAAAGLTIPSAPLDAAILDVLPGPLWGRGEGVQTALRTIAMALAPIIFGYLADVLGATGSHSFGQGTYRPGGDARGLELTFLAMLAALVLAPVLLWRARHSYADDAATAIASEEAVGVRPPSRDRPGRRRHARREGHEARRLPDRRG